MIVPWFVHFFHYIHFYEIELSVLISLTLNFHFFTTQLTFICSKSTIETLEKGVKYVQS